jgi:hypothetical protein
MTESLRYIKGGSQSPLNCELYCAGIQEQTWRSLIGLVARDHVLVLDLRRCPGLPSVFVQRTLQSSSASLHQESALWCMPGSVISCLFVALSLLPLPSQPHNSTQPPCQPQHQPHPLCPSPRLFSLGIPSQHLPFRPLVALIQSTHFLLHAL